MAGLALLFLNASCAYFNTFYNAQDYFEKAEKARLEHRNETLPKAAIDNYERVIEKSEFVLEKYPETRLRKKALFLIAKSHYYRGEYRQAETTLRQMESEFPGKGSEEIQFWLALVKWRLGKPQPAIDELKSILDKPIEDELKARIHSAIADILLEQEFNSEAMDHLEAAATYSKDRKDKGQIYYRIASLSFHYEDYKRALEAYGLVMKYSLSKKEVQEASLKTVQIYRLQGNWKKATNTIKTMLLDEDFKAIHGNLELELVKLYQLQNQHSAARVRLESIVQDYSKTPVAAEAFYLLGEYALKDDWDLETASKNYSSVGKEYSKSRFINLARARIKEITAYENARKKLSELTTVLISASDSTAVDSTIKAKTETILNSMAKHLYTLAELESLHFDQPDSAKIHLQLLLTQTPESPLVPKALYTYSYLLEQSGEDSLAAAYRKQLLRSYPQSEYSKALTEQANLDLGLVNPAKTLLLESETALENDTTLALNKYRQVVITDSVSDAGLLAAYFLGHYFDYEAYQADSAIKYYEKVLNYYPDSEQAKTARKRLALLNSMIIRQQTDSLAVQ
jgi:TolA-binding protein